MSTRTAGGFRIRLWHVTVLFLCCAVWHGFVYYFYLDALYGYVEAIGLLTILSALVPGWFLAERAREERERQIKLARIMGRQPDQHHEWDRPTDTAAP
jgi:hypothetical protein